MLIELVTVKIEKRLIHNFEICNHSSGYATLEMPSQYIKVNLQKIDLPELGHRHKFHGIV